MNKRFNWQPLGVTELRERLHTWMGNTRVGYIEGGTLGGKWLICQQLRGADLLRHWWMRGLQARAWDDGVRAQFEDSPPDCPGSGPENLFEYNPLRIRNWRSVAECFEGSELINPFIGAKRRQ